MTAPTYDSVSALLARIDELEKALTPFATVASAYNARPPEALVLQTTCGDIRVADLRTAAAVRYRRNEGKSGTSATLRPPEVPR